MERPLGWQKFIKVMKTLNLALSCFFGESFFSKSLVATSLWFYDVRSESKIVYWRPRLANHRLFSWRFLLGDGIPGHIFWYSSRRFELTCLEWAAAIKFATGKGFKSSCHYQGGMIGSAREVAETSWDKRSDICLPFHHPLIGKVLYIRLYHFWVRDSFSPSIWRRINLSTSDN